jgi:hypothetical protein
MFFATDSIQFFGWFTDPTEFFHDACTEALITRFDKYEAN